MANEAIEFGLTDMIMGTKLVLRSGVWFAYGWHKAQAADAEKAFESELRTAVLASGKVKSEAARRVKVAKTLGKAFSARFRDHIASDWEGDAEFVQACYQAMRADGVTSEARLLDWAETGDADASGKLAAEKAAEKADAKARAEAAAIDAAADMVASASGRAIMDIDATPEPRSNLEPAAPATPVDPLAFVADMNDEDLAALAKAVSAEKARRTRAAKAA